MKKFTWCLAMVMLLLGSPAPAADLKVGMKATDWSFKDVDGKVYTMATWAGKVLLVNYVDPDKSDLNEHFTDAMKKAVDEKRLKKEHYKGIGIADCAATWKPNFAIRLIAGRKAKKYNTVILFDYKAVLREAWGLKKDTANAVLLDKNRICRAIFRGRVPDDEVEKIVQLAIDLQSK
ncbi:MAG: YtfJ family protein [Desulfobacterales bacterium]|jgi:predicted transcriptional regulator